MLTWWMIILLFVYVVICILLMVAILLQSGKGGGLSSLASGGGIADAIGSTGAERTMNKVTTFVAVSFMLMAILLSLLGAYRSQNGRSEIFDDAPAAAAGAAFPETGAAALPPVPDEQPETPAP
jgi:preprotein translocase subunit SecG